MRKFAVILLPLVFISCSFINGQEKTGMKEVTLTPAQESMVNAGNSFAFTLFREVCHQQRANDRIFISPYSISEALTMTYNGAANATADSMKRLLGYEAVQKEDINLYCKTMRSILLDLDSNVNLSIANSIWYSKEFSVRESFKNINAAYFDAAVKNLDFSDPRVKDVINGWIEDKTNNRIKDMIKEVDPSTVMFLVNAIWFKGQWMSRFNKSNTREDIFYLSDMTPKKTCMMNQTLTCNYFSNDLIQVAELPYGQGNFVMDVLLPVQGKTTDDVLVAMTPENWQSWTSAFKGQKLNLGLPRLTFEYSSMLNNVLSAMGMGIAFSSFQADFTGINPGKGLYISYVQHNSFLEINEEGTEAAAATVVAMTKSAALPEKAIPFKVNRPFVFAIRECSTGAILFLGRVNAPAN